MTQLRVDDVSCTCRLMSNADLRSSMMKVSMSASMTCRQMAGSATKTQQHINQLRFCYHDNKTAKLTDTHDVSENFYTKLLPVQVYKYWIELMITRLMVTKVRYLRTIFNIMVDRYNTPG